MLTGQLLLGRKEVWREDDTGEEGTNSNGHPEGWPSIRKQIYNLPGGRAHPR